MLIANFILTIAALLPGITPQATAVAESPFPPSTALAEGVSPDALGKLGALIDQLVDDDEIVGAELLVIKNGRSILHEAYGWRDRESERPMETGSVFCVRSMTKPLIAAAVLMLVDDRVLKLDAPVYEYLPAFDVEGSRGITVEHLLSHTSGLPMSLILGKDLHQLDGIQAVAELGAGHTLAFEPGSAFSYSDQGTDTLTAMIEAVTHMPAAEFVRTRLLEPLGMQESACVMTEEHPLRARGCSKYVGSPSNWTRFWKPDDAPLFPFFLGSQGLYSTLEDYARFMRFWERKGRSDSERLLGARFVRKALTPNPFPMGAPTGLPGLRVDYGFLMQLWTGMGNEGESGDRELVAFGHTGSDGTHAWVFPEEDAMVLYFTQSRGTTTGLQVEEVLGELFLGVPFDPNQVAPPFEQYLGYYREDEKDDLYRAIVRDGDDMALEILGQGVVALTYLGEDRWKFRQNPSIVLEFQRADSGEVTGYHIGDHKEYRFEPSEALPSVDALATRVAGAHHIDLLETLGPIRMRGKVVMEKLGMAGDVTSVLAWPDRYRSETTMGENFERVAYDGLHVWTESSLKPRATVEGPRGKWLQRESALARLGDWRRTYPHLRVLQQIERGGKQVYVVRTGDTSAPARTLYVDVATGRVLREEGLTEIEGMGRVGQRITLGDYREVAGMQLPFRIEYEYPNPLIGTIVTTVDGYEQGVEVTDGTFTLSE